MTGPCGFLCCALPFLSRYDMRGDAPGYPDRLGLYVALRGREGLTVGHAAIHVGVSRRTAERYEAVLRTVDGSPPNARRRDRPAATPAGAIGPMSGDRQRVPA